MPVTIKDLAKKAGVSIATVSRAIRPETSHLVKRNTRDFILSLIDEEEYIPNRIAINLVQKKTSIIGLTIPYFPSHLETNDYFASLVAGVMDCIVNSNYDLKLIIVPEGTVNEKQMRLLKANRVDGLIISGWPTFTQFEEILDMKFPIMIINDYKEDIPAHFVYSDSFGGGYKAGKHLINLGYKHLGVTSPKPEWFPDMDARIEGFKKALREEGLELEEKWIVPSGVTEESGYQTMLKVLEIPERPRAFFFINDASAIGALKAIREKGIKCPQEIAIIGFDDIRLGRYVSPTLSTIHQPTYELGKEGAKLLVDIIEHEVKTLIREKLPTELIIRESCGGLKIV